MKTVLFAGELGRGLGHVMNIRRIASRLKAHDVRIVAAVNKSAPAGLLDDVADNIIGAPSWAPDSGQASLHSTASSATLNDILSSAGLADKSAVHRLLVAWDDIFTATQPDLLVADFSPLAALAARKRIPLVLIGNGYTLPPHEMRRFPLLHRHLPPVWSEEQTLDAVNGAAQELGLDRLDHLPQLFRGDAMLVQTLPLLDPYDTQRLGPLDGPLFEYDPKQRNADARTVFVYLSGGYVPHPSIFEALISLASRLRIHAPRMPVAHLASLRKAGAQVDAAPPSLGGALLSSRIILHNGGSGVAVEALVSGVPQIVLSAQIEQDLNGEALERAGVAKLTRMYVPGASITSQLINAMATDQALADRASELGKWYRNDLKSKNALLHCERTCLALLAR